MSDERKMTLFFNDGSELSLSFPKQGGNPHMLAKRIQAALDSSKLAFEVDNELLVIPTHNIKYLRVSPCPEMLPDTVILGGAVEV